MFCGELNLYCIFFDRPYFYLHDVYIIIIMVFCIFIIFLLLILYYIILFYSTIQGNIVQL